MAHDRWQLVVIFHCLDACGRRPDDTGRLQAAGATGGHRAAAPDGHQQARSSGLARALSQAWLGIAGGWCLVGVSIWAASARAAAKQSHAVPSEVALSIAAGALSVVAGFVSFIPGGLVVRDAVMLELFGASGRYGPGTRMWLWHGSFGYCRKS